MNLYDYTPTSPGQERTDILHEDTAVRIERIVSNLARTQWYDQDQDEWLVLLKGTAELAVERNRVTLEEGDTLFLPAHCRHRVLSTSDETLWLTVFVKV